MGDNTVEHAKYRAKIREAIHEWIREDVGVAIKMTITPDLVAKLIDRIAS